MIANFSLLTFMLAAFSVTAVLLLVALGRAK